MSVMGLKNKFVWGVGCGWGELYLSFILDFLNLFNFAKPLHGVTSTNDDNVSIVTTIDTAHLPSLVTS